MKNSLMVIAILALAVSSAIADQTYTWDFNVVTDPLILGSYGAEYVVELDPAMNYEGGDGYALKIIKGPGGTLQIYLAAIWGLAGGDMVTASFDRYDDTPNGEFTPDSPACRIWAHYNDSLPDDLTGFNGSASGNFDYGLGEGWDNTNWTWEIWTGHTGIVIECRSYEFPGDTVWIDNLSVTVPDHAWVMTPFGIYTPDGGVIAAEAGTWGGVKALYR